MVSADSATAGESETDAASEADWGAVALTEALRTVVADVGRLQNLLPELSPRDRCRRGQCQDRCQGLGMGSSLRGDQQRPVVKADAK